MKYCINCGNQLQENADFCNKCGKFTNNNQTFNQNNMNQIQPKKPSSGFAITGFIFSLISILIFFLGPIALLLSIIGLIVTLKGKKSGLGFAITGICISVFTVLITCIVIILLSNYADDNKKESFKLGAELLITAIESTCSLNDLNLSIYPNNSEYQQINYICEDSTSLTHEDVDFVDFDEFKASGTKIIDGKVIEITISNDDFIVEVIDGVLQEIIVK